MTDLLPLDDALAIIQRAVSPLRDTVRRPLAEALHGVTAEAISAPRALPPFTNTGVDGYAFQFGGPDKRAFKLIGASFAGAPFTATVPHGAAVRIATGGVLPAETDTVVMQEQCEIDGDRLTLKTVPAQGANIRRSGADIAQGAEALSSGHRLRPQDIALLGALGLRDVSVLRRPRLAIISTGLELVSPEAVLSPGQIVDTNGMMLQQLLAADDVEVSLLAALPDDYPATRQALSDAAQEYDLIITTGGVSVGDRDYVQAALHDLGIVHFWKLAVRPGKPALLGRIGDGLVMGLPGNPVSALVTFLLLVRPLLAVMRGGVAQLPPAYPLPLAIALPKEVQLRSFPRARLTVENGRVQAMPYHDQSSNLFTSLTAGDGILDLPLEATSYKAGDIVLFRPFTGLL